jgi:hypothetical protein
MTQTQQLEQHETRIKILEGIIEMQTQALSRIESKLDYPVKEIKKETPDMS